MSLTGSGDLSDSGRGKNEGGAMWLRNSRFPQMHNQHGAVLLMVLVAVTLMGLMAGIAGSSWQTIVQRERETDLLWKGNQIRQAIGHYIETSQSQGVKVFPAELDHLLLDPRFQETTRHLRRLYADPMSGQEWELIPAPGGGIAGVRSVSTKTPFQQNNFPDENKSFAGQQSYHDWQFVFQPTKSTPTKKPVPATGQQPAASSD